MRATIVLLAAFSMAPALADLAGTAQAGSPAEGKNATLSPGVSAVIKMTKAGVPPDMMINAIKSSVTPVNLTPDDLVALKQANVPDDVIRALSGKQPPKEPSVAQPPQAKKPQADAITSPQNLAAPSAQSQTAVSQQSPPTEKRRIFISDSQSWDISGKFNADSGRISGGARPQTVEVMKTFQKRCPEVTVTNNPSSADYVVLFDRESGKGGGLLTRSTRKDNKIAVFAKNGDMLYSGSTSSLGNAVKDACAAVLGRIQH